MFPEENFTQNSHSFNGAFIEFFTVLSVFGRVAIHPWINWSGRAIENDKDVMLNIRINEC